MGFQSQWVKNKLTVHPWLQVCANTPLKPYLKAGEPDVVKQKAILLQLLVSTSNLIVFQYKSFRINESIKGIKTNVAEVEWVNISY